MELNLIDTAIANRSLVKVSDSHGWAAGTVGILLGYRASYDNVKVGFIDESGEYTGEYTTAPRSAVCLAPVATPDIVTTVTAYGESIEIRTPKGAPDAQHAHTVKFFEAYNELRRRELDRIPEPNKWTAARLAPVKVGQYPESSGLYVGSKYNGTFRKWVPVLPLVPWSAPKPLSDREALARARKLDGKMHSAGGQLVGQISFDVV